MQMTRFVERSFHLESQDERDEWVKAYEDVWLATLFLRVVLFDPEIVQIKKDVLAQTADERVARAASGMGLEGASFVPR